MEVNCAAIPGELWESECFGSAKNAYTQAAERPGRFAAAEGGTLFLDEVGEMPLEQQASCCACSTRATTSASARTARGSRTCGSSPPPIGP